MQSQFEEYEDLTGLKYSFNVLPRTKEQEKKCVIPISCLYQPLRPKENLITIESYPISCKSCSCILNPYCILDSNNNCWICSICNNRNLFPNNLNQLPIELNPDLIDVEYILPDNNLIKPCVFTYIVDLAIEFEELESLKDSLINSINLLPNNSLFNLITFGKNVNVYEISIDNKFSNYTFNGLKEYTRSEINEKLGIIKKNQQNNNNLITENNRFFQSVSISEFNIISIIESLKCDSFKSKDYNRKERSTGSAINIAFNMISTLYSKIGSRILLFSGGVSTIGPGSIVTTPFKDSIRSHNDLINDNKIIKKFEKNCNFFKIIAEKASINGHTIDIFIGCYDQIGLNEMELLVDKTGGVIVQSDSFTSAIFKQSLIKLLSLNEFGESQFGLNSTLEIKCSNLKINGLIGHATPLYLNSNKLSNSNKIKFFNDFKKDKSIGLNGTDCFKLGSISTHSTYAIYFDLNEKIIGDYSIIQFITTYQNIDGKKHIHVTTSQKFLNSSINSTSMLPILNNFDQEAATILIARESIFKVSNESNIDALRFINKILIDFLTNFSNFRINDSKSVIIPNNVNLLPQFIYHLRRSNFIQIFNSSPDETTFYRHCFLTEDCYNSLIMIQPTLTSYEIGKEPEPVLLDSTSIKPDRILFLDTFFHILIYHGSSIAEWRRHGYQEQEEYSYLKDFLELPKQEAAEILTDRFPLPRFIDTEEGGSQARFLMSKLNPTTSYKMLNDAEYAMVDGGINNGNNAVIMTDDISLQSFMQFVYDAIVKPA